MCSQGKAGLPQRSRGGGPLSAALVVAALALATLMPTRALAACGDFYRVKDGDTLQLIAARQIGDPDFRSVFVANSDILWDPSLIEVGQLLYLPCASRPATRRAALAKAGIRPTRRDDVGDRLALAERPGGADGPARANSAAALKVLTVSGLAPLVDRGLPSDGMALVIVGEALNTVSDPRVVVPAFVDNWDSHLPALMPTGDFPLALPWPRPDCAGATLSVTARKMCENFLFSEPFYEIPVATLVPVDSPLVEARSFTALEGRTICRPAGFPPVDIEQAAEDLRIVGAPTAPDCAQLVTDGKADAISLPEPAAQRLLGRPGSAGALTRARYLGTSVPVHAVAWRGDPGAEALIGKIDTGLREMLASGRWMEAISSYLRKIDRFPISQ